MTTMKIRVGGGGQGRSRVASDDEINLGCNGNYQLMKKICDGEDGARKTRGDRGGINMYSIYLASVTKYAMT